MGRAAEDHSSVAKVSTLKIVPKLLFKKIRLESRVKCQENRTEIYLG